MNFEQFFGGGFGGSPFGRGHQKPQGPKTFKLYDLMGLDKDADEKAIKKKYRVMSMKVTDLGDYRHPDRGGSREKFQMLQQAYDHLGNPQKKKVYDKYGDACLKSDFQGEPEAQIPKKPPPPSTSSASALKTCTRAAARRCGCGAACSSTIGPTNRAKLMAASYGRRATIVTGKVPGCK